MNNRSLLLAAFSGGKTAVLSSLAGCTGLLIYSLLAGDRVIYLSPWLMAVAFAGVFLGGIRGGMEYSAMGWLHGGMVALLYLVIIYMIKQAVFPAAGFGPAGLATAAGIMAAGGAGGVLGVNLRYAHRRRLKRRYIRGM
ncbi:MAG: TIGR04086 family membrane protein [Firmicutes bacterium HGW-Firmicutes-14]|nr:MAG: TIGR04086 family membrane protein [Firmicutes bacterium HGW-Firmicutes-14]